MRSAFRGLSGILLCFGLFAQISPQPASREDLPPAKDVWVVTGENARTPIQLKKGMTIAQVQKQAHNAGAVMAMDSATDPEGRIGDFFLDFVGGRFDKLRAVVAHVGNGVTSPSVIRHVDPSYSPEARKKKVAGTVLLSMFVDTIGKARAIRVVKSLGFGLDEKAITAAGKWTFNPGMIDGHPVNVRVQIEVNFRLI